MSQAAQLQQMIQDRNYDLHDPDNQLLRYRHMMNSQYHNSQANSISYNQSVMDQKNRYGELAGDTKKHYDMQPKNM